jgi:acylphosphatase
MARLHMVVYGRVQGVGFRAFVRAEAVRSGIAAGWVRNRADGAVELAAEADAPSLARFEAAVMAGPAWAEVTRVEHLPPPGEPLPQPFAILG